MNIGANVELEPRTVDNDASWVLVLGAAGSVGQFGLQVTKLRVFFDTFTNSSVASQDMWL